MSAHGKKKETLAPTEGVLRWCLPIRLHVYIPFGLFRNLASGNPNQLFDPGARLNPESRDPDKEKKDLCLQIGGKSWAAFSIGVLKT